MGPEEFTELGYDVSDGVATLTLNRPHRRNAWTGQMAVEYRWALAIADADPAVGAIVVTGAGSAFCIGADAEILTEVDKAGGAYERLKADLPPFPDGTPAGLRHNHTYPLAIGTPVIAAINGACAGAGFVLACYADFRMAVEDTKITASFAGLGLPAEYGTAWVLPRITGLQNALEILLVNPIMSGRDAVELGFLRRAHPAEEFAGQVREFATGIARRSAPSSLAIMKRQLYVDANTDLDTAYRSSVEHMNRMVGEPDFSEGLRALRERRAPRFRVDGAPEVVAAGAPAETAVQAP